MPLDLSMHFVIHQATQSLIYGPVMQSQGHQSMSVAWFLRKVGQIPKNYRGVLFGGRRSFLIEFPSLQVNIILKGI